MSKKDQTIVDYSEDVQRLLLQFMISDPDAFARSQNILKPEYWDEKLRKAPRYILKYADEYHTLPMPEQIKAETGITLEKLIPEDVAHASGWYFDTIEAFCKHKAMEQLIWDGPDIIQSGLYAELERRSKENMLISLQNDLGTDYFDDPLTRLKKMRDRTGLTSTGWRDVDQKIYGGVNRGELTFFVGGPGCVTPDTKVRVIKLLDI
jgi:hypothetical protein